MHRLSRYLVHGVLLSALASSAAAQQPTFRSSVDLVSVTAIARDERGRTVRDLTRGDFEVLEQGQARRIKEFKVSDQGPVSLAILLDVSGSMRGAPQTDASRKAVEFILSWLQPDADEVSLFSFDRELRQEVPFTKDPAKVREGLYQIEALGLTSLYDAIGRTAKTLANRPSPRRAVIVVTDGLDTSSELTPAEVSGIASAIDVPVYVIAVLSPLDHPGTKYALPAAATSPVSTHLSNLAYWTGGTLMMASAPAHASLAARVIVNELRHQYLLAFEASRKPGWYPIEVRTSRKNVSIRARSGYFAGGATPQVPVSWSSELSTTTRSGSR